MKVRDYLGGDKVVRLVPMSKPAATTEDF